ncbi:hypothetical protein HJG60_009944 [Phyllostomus discolor]|uniref:Uncharacterized protein n=1 Tax=Phyllostomus discolor TaxID=89673 RepID=A0A834ET86_9CHIR|nr:hypothetical protein HJG60_009944 [Phyllostomus discolor]
MAKPKGGRIEGGRWGWVRKRKVVVEKWRQLYLNNNKKKLKKAKNFFKRKADLKIYKIYCETMVQWDSLSHTSIVCRSNIHDDGTWILSIRDYKLASFDPAQVTSLLGDHFMVCEEANGKMAQWASEAKQHFGI